MNKKKSTSASATPEAILLSARQVIIGALERGLSLDGAAGLAGIARARFLQWRVSDPDFEDEIAAAQARCENRIVSIVAAASSVDPKLAMEFLRHRFPHRWGTTELRRNEEERAIQQYDQMLMQGLQAEKEKITEEYKRRMLNRLDVIAPEVE